MADTPRIPKPILRLMLRVFGRWWRPYLWLIAVMASVSLSGCHTLRLFPPGNEKIEKVEKDPGPTLPGKKSFRVAQYVFLSDFDVQRDLPIFQELSDLHDQVYKELQLPSSSSLVQVYLFEDKDRYERFMQSKYPDLPKRRAFFVAQPRAVGSQEDLLVYTYWGKGDHINQDLRHELTHALLHSVLKGVPLWLDEGLAEYFEVPPDSQGVNTQHLQHLRRDGLDRFCPDLARLEQLSQQEESSAQQVAQMTAPEYRESWAWVHLMLRGRPEAKAALLVYLQQLRTTAKPGPLQPRLIGVYPELNEALVQHLVRIEPPSESVPTAQR